MHRPCKSPANISLKRTRNVIQLLCGDWGAKVWQRAVECAGGEPTGVSMSLVKFPLVYSRELKGVWAYKQLSIQAKVYRFDWPTLNGNRPLKLMDLDSVDQHGQKGVMLQQIGIPPEKVQAGTSIVAPKLSNLLALGSMRCWEPDHPHTGHLASLHQGWQIAQHSRKGPTCAETASPSSKIHTMARRVMLTRTRVALRVSSGLAKLQLQVLAG